MHDEAARDRIATEQRTAAAASAGSALTDDAGADRPLVQLV